MDELLAWLGWLGQIVRGYVVSAAFSKSKTSKNQDEASQTSEHPQPSFKVNL
jgi:hypothetical protein